MSRIYLLDSSVYNKIAAGEVVERPSSVVKELVENSIDAGADRIIIEITNGGLRKIRISDNGAGINYEDMEVAFMPHSTSKLKAAEDLNKISTLGFRGEALASIASVSMITAISKMRDSSNGCKLEIKGGEIISKMPWGAGEGTVIDVENLFFNTPARLKFIKKPAYEESEIKSLVSDLILANPYISIELITDGKKVFSSEGNGLDGAIKAVFDREYYNNLIPVQYEKGGYRINGFVGKRSFSKSNRTYQTIILNGRIISNQLISSAAAKAYGESLMKRCYPVFILDITVPFDSVDVNVHPQKAEVRFTDNNLIYAIVYSSVNRALNQSEEILELKATKDLPEDEADTAAPATEVKRDYSYKDFKPVYDKTSISEYDALITNQNNVSESAGISARIIENIKELKPQIKSRSDEIAPLNDYKIVGQLFNTYLIVEYGSDALIIDQHAAMERLNYDRLMNAVKAEEITKLTQPMLIPYILRVNHIEQSIINENLNCFISLGIEIEPFGNNTFKVSALPIIYGDINLDMFFKTVIGELMSGGKATIEDIVKEKIATSACKASIKGGDALSAEQIKILLRGLTTDKIPLECPHGRPAVIRLTRYELEKWFKRKV